VNVATCAETVFTNLFYSYAVVHDSYWENLVAPDTEFMHFMPGAGK